MICIKRLYAFTAILIIAALTTACATSYNKQNNISEDSISIDINWLDEESYDLKTASPEVIEYRTVSDGRVVISGTCEEGATIYVFRDKVAALTSKSHYGSFLFEFYIDKKDSPLTVTLYAKDENKALSDPVEQTVYYRTEDPGISEWVWVGKDFHLFFSSTADNYFRNDVLTEEEANFAKQRISERITWLDQNLTAKAIYILVPNPNEIYGEYMPDIGEQPKVQSLHEQTVNILTEAGAVVIDMKPILEQHKNDELKIYHRTDSHWTEYAAYFAYNELFSYIKQSFPAAAPRQIEDFGFKNESRQVGDLYTDLWMDETKLYETSTYSNLKFETPNNIKKYKNSNSTLIHDDPTKEHIFYNEEKKGKPEVIILRDSYSIMMFDFIAERCATTTLRAMWDFRFDRELFKSLDIDYCIYIVSDMNLKNLYK